MGWVVYENYPLDNDPGGSSCLVTLPDERFPDIDAVALMFSWRDVETNRGAYDFSRADRAYDFWQKRGKEIQLRISSESLMFPTAGNPESGAGVPPYVLDQLKPEEKQTRLMEQRSYAVPDARNPFYRERLGLFLRAVHEHFGPSRPITLIDLRGFGAWGEWHSGFRYPDLDSRRDALKRIIDLWSDAFQGRLLALSFSYDPDGPKELYAGSNKKFDPGFTTNYLEFLRFSAFDYALTKTNITFRRDGCGGAVHSNERKLNEEAFSHYGRAPMFCEFLGGYAAAKQAGSNWVNFMIEDALSLHPNYINLLGWQAEDARNFVRERPDLIARGLLEMGYRLVPIELQYPASITNGIPFELKSKWVNRGVGRAPRDFQLQLTLLKPDGSIAGQSSPQAISNHEWVNGTIYPLANQIKFPSVPAADYDLAICLHDPITSRSITLPLLNRHGDSYPVGIVRVP